MSFLPQYQPPRSPPQTAWNWAGWRLKSCVPVTSWSNIVYHSIKLGLSRSLDTFRAFLWSHVRPVLVFWILFPLGSTPVSELLQFGPSSANWSVEWTKHYLSTYAAQRWLCFPVWWHKTDLVLNCDDLFECIFFIPFVVVIVFVLTEGFFFCCSHRHYSVCFLYSKHYHRYILCLLRLCAIILAFI